MPRNPNPNCVECSLLPIAQVMQRHGEDGDGCWNPKTCPRRRSHYRHRADSNAKRRGVYATQRAIAQVDDGVESIAIPVTFPAVALIYLYREVRKDAHLHAIAVTVWQGERKLAVVEPIHCMGMTNSQVNQYLREVLGVLGDRFGIGEFEPAVRLEPMECPIRPCPLQGC